MVLNINSLQESNQPPSHKTLSSSQATFISVCFSPILLEPTEPLQTPFNTDEIPEVELADLLVTNISNYKIVDSELNIS